MKKDYIFLLLAIAVMVITSCHVQDSRAMIPEKDMVEEIVKEVNKHIEDAHYFVTDSPSVDKTPTVEEAPVIEEVHNEVNDVQQTEEIVNPTQSLEAKNESPGLVYIGDYRITAYEWTGNPCANGNYPTEGYTVACNDLPFGTEVYIDGVGWRVVEDRGGGGVGWMDLYMGDVDTCYEWGVQYRGVYVYE